MVSSIGFKICLFPNKTQEEILFKFVNHTRGLWNLLLAESKNYYNLYKKQVDFNYLYRFYQKQKETDNKWLKEIPEASAKQVCKDLIEAYKRVWKSGFGFPKFKKKGKCKESFYQRTDKLRFIGKNYVKITGLKSYIKCNRGYLDLPFDDFCNPRVSYDGKHWYLSFSYQGIFYENREVLSPGIGIDAGLKNFITVSNGEVLGNYNNFENIRKLESRIKILQQVVSRKYEINRQGNRYIKTKNITKLEKKIRLLKRKVSNIKLTCLHNYTSYLVRTKPEFIAVETLAVKEMKEADNDLSKEMQKVAWYEFFRQLKYKSDYMEIPMFYIDKYFPSSKRCSLCGNILSSLKLSDRMYECPVCTNKLDRDLNAALNIELEGRRLYRLSLGY